jgi:hypothetical protein
MEWGGVMKKRGAEVRRIRNEDDLRKLYEIEVEEYGAESIVGLKTLEAWWERFPDATFCLATDDQIIGGMLIWPLEEDAFDRLSSGQLDEYQMLESHVARKKGSATFNCWYIGDIVLQKDYRLGRERWSARLLVEALNHWLNGENLSHQLRISALAYSTQGRLLAERLKFHPCASSPDGYTVFKRETSREEFQHDVSRLSDRFRMTES